MQINYKNQHTSYTHMMFKRKKKTDKMMHFKISFRRWELSTS